MNARTAVKQKAFSLDLNRCTGCGACIIACATENSGRQGLNWRQVYTFNESHHPAAPLFNLSLACNHCVSPACVKACPAAAIHKDAETGAVQVDQERCLGCKYCTWACPYDAPQYNPARGVMEKCDFCLERLKRDESTACAQACPVGALRLEDYDHEPPPLHIHGFTEAGLKPAIRFKPLRDSQGLPEATSRLDPQTINRLFESSQRMPQRKISLQAEWALLIFTSLAFILVAVFTASLVIPLRMNPYLFLAVGAAAMGLSTIHLGQKQRAFRAIFNLKSSWLSREIFLFTAFLGSAFLYQWWKSFPSWMGWTSAIIGFAGLWAIDRIYQVAMKTGPLNFHSAHTFLDAGYVLAALIGHSGLFTFFGLIKLGLYTYRKIHFKLEKRKARPWVSAGRIVLGFILPGLIFFYGINGGRPSLGGLYGLLIAFVLLGELIDRMEYYDEMEIVTPRKQMLMDLERFLQNNHTKNVRQD